MGVEDWQPIETAPQDGTRVLVAHEMDPSSTKESKWLVPATGIFEDGRWKCSVGFVCWDGMFRWTPTHWRPRHDA